MGDFSHQKLPSRGLQTLWEWKNRVLLEEYYISNVANAAQDSRDFCQLGDAPTHRTPARYDDEARPEENEGAADGDLR